LVDQVLIPILLSLKIVLVATAGAFTAGVALARLLTRKTFSGKKLIESLVMLPMVLPPTVVGFGLLVLFGGHGPLGIFVRFLFGRQVLFTWWAAVIAAMVAAFPLVYQSARGAFASVDFHQEQAARTLGANEARVFFTVTLPLAWPGIMSGLVLAFARALGEFGATLMVAGNIPGKTQTVPLAIYFAVESGDYRTAALLVATTVLLSLP
jgi:molybdate transport system permease protein